MYTDDDDDDADAQHQNSRADGPNSLRRINDGTKITLPMVSATAAAGSGSGGESSTHSTHMSNEFRRNAETRSSKRNDGSRRASNYNDVHIQVSEQLMQFEEQNQQQELNEYRPMGVVGYVCFVCERCILCSHVKNCRSRVSCFGYSNVSHFLAANTQTAEFGEYLLSKQQYSVLECNNTTDRLFFRVSTSGEKVGYRKMSSPVSSNIPFTLIIRSYDYKSEINKTNFLGTGGKLATAYAQLLKEMWLSNKKVVKPIQFKKQLGKFAPQFSGTYQHDAQELLSFLLDGIHEDLNRVKDKPYIEDRDCNGKNDEKDAIEAWKNYLARNKSLVVDLFQGQLRNTCRCNKCEHTNIRFEPFMYLSLPISDSCQTLQDCLDLYISTDELKGENRWYCEKCKKHRDGTKKIDLWITPPILIVHLKRFKYNEYGHVGSKNNVDIRFPMEGWDLSGAVKSKGSVSSVYDLYAVSNHFGNLRSGHYTAYSLTRFDEQVRAAKK